jgi:hypothetical protein
MGLYGFKARFAPFILDGRKQHTIRKIRADGRLPRVGEICHCYVGLRQPGARLLGRWPCTKIESIYILDYEPARVWVDGNVLSGDELERLARADGFADWEEMVCFWQQEHTLPFHGHIIHWKFSKAGTNE